MEELQQRAQMLIEALPYIQAWAGKTIVIKYGGSVMTDPALKAGVAQDLALLRYVGICPVGGCPLRSTCKPSGVRRQDTGAPLPNNSTAPRAPG